ncbi:hypothetical protein [Pseudomonas oryzihabitans]|uniref:Uncharacterized protein n=1 Tax=Pseudomonas oryzihabitans TaxID=47885 RepID=A0A1G5PGM5_9PSED|nr:hypothetical protein [Pseudomonas psychrotolerans]NMY92702.1 hypothetical protein [Pseudomonas psychrotolerans]SCZ48643.1 hypothetical protein SAMN05216279_12918 [Pseudomonas psychrotolerans]
MTKYSFKKRIGTDASDPEFVLQHCGAPTRIQIQDSLSWGGGYAVSVDHLDDEAEPHLLWVALSIASFAEAARVAIGHFEANPLARVQATAPGAEPGSL